ncbi:MAG: hypothetical protein JW827_07220, partial [Spirochaetes bacterium]|nr:hypothetical protein [Spirochaetota bacterium]
GAKMWIVDWDPFFKEPMTIAHGLTGVTKDFDLEPAVMAGPTLSFLFGNFGIATSLSYGVFKGYSLMEGYETTNPSKTRINKGTITANRLDLDASLSFRLVSQLRIFAGYKFQNFEVTRLDFDAGITNAAYDDVHVNDMTVKSALSGPGGGIGYTHNFGNFFIGATVAAVLLTGDYDPDTEDKIETSKSISEKMFPSDWGMEVSAVGITVEPQFGFRAGDRSILLLGLRYQNLQSKIKAKSATGLWPDENNIMIFEKEATDTFIGGSLSISLLF